MALYETGVLSVAAASSAAYLQLRTAAPRIRVREIHLVQTQAIVSAVGLVRSLTVGATPTSVQAIPQDTADAATTANVDTAWGTQPTVAATPVYLRRANLGGTVGNGVVWSWWQGAGLLVPATAGLLLWNPSGSAGGVLAVNIVYDE